MILYYKNLRRSLAVTDLPKFGPGKPQEFNGMEVSYGVAAILNSIADLAYSQKKNYWTLYLVNVETLIRDRKNNEQDVDKIARNVIIDCTVLAQYLAAYVKSMSTPRMKVEATVCFYMNKYENIPTTYIKDKLPKGTEIRWKIRDRVYEIITKEGYISNYDDVTVTFSLSGLKKNTWPHRDFVKDLIRGISGVQFKKTLMISHVPLDFHLYKVFNDFTILESYTGKFKTHKDFGSKVFGDSNIPFNKYTHLLLGDKWYLKSLLDNKTKKSLIERATREHWALLPDRAVLQSLVDMHLPIQDLFIKPEI